MILMNANDSYYVWLYDSHSNYHDILFVLCHQPMKSMMIKDENLVWKCVVFLLSFFATQFHIMQITFDQKP